MEADFVVVLLFWVCLFMFHGFIWGFFYYPVSHAVADDPINLVMIICDLLLIGISAASSLWRHLLVNNNWLDYDF